MDCRACGLTEPYQESQLVNRFRENIMAEYQKIEYYIDKSGKLTETVINISGSSCTAATSSVEKALGEVES